MYPTTSSTAFRSGLPAGHPDPHVADGGGRVGTAMDVEQAVTARPRDGDRFVLCNSRALNVAVGAVAGAVVLTVPATGAARLACGPDLHVLRAVTIAGVAAGVVVGVACCAGRYRASRIHPAGWVAAAVVVGFAGVSWTYSLAQGAPRAFFDRPGIVAGIGIGVLVVAVGVEALAVAALMGLQRVYTHPQARAT